MPLLVNLQPAGEYLGEDYYRAGGVPAVVGRTDEAGLIHEDALTVNGKTHGRELPRAPVIQDREVIRAFDKPLKKRGRLPVLKRQPVRLRDHEDQRDLRRVPRPLPLQPGRPDGLRGPAVVFDGPEDYHHRIDDPTPGSTTNSMLFIRGAGPIGYPGAAEVVNMQPPRTC